MRKNPGQMLHPSFSGAVLRGASRTINLQVDAGGDADLRIRAAGKVSRRDFGLEWDSAFAAGGLVINDRVALQFDILLVRRDAA